MSKQTPGDWLLWQMIDSAFPVGGFAHSGGLEAATQMGEISSIDVLRSFIEASLLQCARWWCPLAEAVRAGDASFDHHDRTLDRMMTSVVANRASRTQGQSWLATADAVWRDERLSAERERLRRDEIAGHWPTCFGLVAGRLGFNADATASALLFVQLRGLMSAAVRLGLLGPMEAQRLQTSLNANQPIWLDLARRTLAEDAAPTAPLLDLFQAQHDRLYSRLFMS